MGSGKTNHKDQGQQQTGRQQHRAGRRRTGFSGKHHDLVDFIQKLHYPFHAFRTASRQREAKHSPAADRTP